MRFKDLSFKYKMALLPLLASASFLLILLITFSFGSRNKELLTDIESGYAVALEWSRDLEQLLDEVQRKLQGAVAAEDQDELAEVQGVSKAFVERLEAGRSNPVIENKMIDGLKTSFESYLALATKTSARLIHKDRGEQLTRDLQAMATDYSRVRDELRSSTRQRREEMRAAFAEAGALQKESLFLSSLIILVCVALLGVVSVLVVAAVARPLQALARATAKIAREGDLTERIDVGSRDEIGQLGSSFSEMVASLWAISTRLQQSAYLVRDSVAELNTSTAEQSQTLSRHAAALQETQVTAQEIKQTSALAAQKAEIVLQYADRTEAVSRSAESAVEQSVSSLTEIRGQVDEIAQTIKKLGERSSQIGRITATVKQLADQSNMLALNAAIEAVRSGEHGKGFAVVAREIRSLADQSIQATSQVRDILEDIATATRFAVAITQTGAERIEAGLSEVKKSGESIKELSGIVNSNTALVRQIAAAVSQQNVGISQVFTAVADQNKLMDDTVQRLRATDQSASTLQEVSEKLLDAVKRFRV